MTGKETRAGVVNKKRVSGNLIFLGGGCCLPGVVVVVVAVVVVEVVPRRAPVEQVVGGVCRRRRCSRRGRQGPGFEPAQPRRLVGVAPHPLPPAVVVLLEHVVVLRICGLRKFGKSDLIFFSFFSC